MTSRTVAVRYEIRESSGRTQSSNRPVPVCSSSVTRAWKRRPFLSTSTMSPAPMPLEVARGGAAGAASGQGSIRLSCISRTLEGVADGAGDGLPHAPVQADVGGAVRTHLEDRAAVPGERAVERGAQRLGVRDALERAPVQRRGVGEVEAVGSRDVALEVRALALHGQEVEDPAAVVVEQDDDEW